VKDVYRTIVTAATFRQKIERSDFLGIVFPVASENVFAERLEATRKQHFDATHHCWAFRLFTGERARSSDAGEPSGSAGKPILSAIEGADLYDVGLVVTRWYGGVKLGTGGLSRAYRSTAAGAIANASVHDRYVYVRVAVLAPFDRVSDLYRLVDPPAVILAAEEYGDRNVFQFDVRASAEAAFRARLVEKRLTLL
jgi:uncharacterized YigZ family protein